MPQAHVAHEPEQEQPRLEELDDEIGSLLSKQADKVKEARKAKIATEQSKHLLENKVNLMPLPILK